ncbi:hypothetical protein GCM10028798_03130 [Humibacter antri]
MTQMRADHRRVMLSALLRMLKAAERTTDNLAHVAPVPGSWVEQVMSSPICSTPSWNGNKPGQMLRSIVTLGCQAGVQNGLALYELSRNARSLSVPLAAVARAAVEAYGRVFWVLGPDTPTAVVGRVASLEHSELVYPERFGTSMRRLPVEQLPTHPVDEYRRLIREWAKDLDITLDNIGYSRLAISLLDEVSDDGAGAYSELSATAHGVGWAAANFLDFEAMKLRMNDQQLIDYCMTVLNVTGLVVDRLVDRFGLVNPSLERWEQARDAARAMTGSFIVRARHLG